MTLADQLQSTVETVRGALKPADFTAIMQSITDLQEAHLSHRAAGVGARPVLPALPDAAGERVDLAALRQRGPLVVTFYRGGWCPYCNVTLRALAEIVPALREAGATLVAVTPEQPDHIAETASRAEAPFAILHDAGNAFARSLGLVFTLPEALRPLHLQLGIDLPATNGDGSYTLPIPATYVIDRDGAVAWAFIEADFTRRAEPADILRAVSALRPS